MPTTLAVQAFLIIVVGIVIFAVCRDEPLRRKRVREAREAIMRKPPVTPPAATPRPTEAHQPG